MVEKTRLADGRQLLVTNRGLAVLVVVLALIAGYYYTSRKLLIEQIRAANCQVEFDR